VKVIITGAGGFIGAQLLRELCRRGRIGLKPTGEMAISSIVAADIRIPEESRKGLPDWVSFVERDLSTDEAVDSIIPEAEDFLLFHLAAIVSGDGERDFDLCIRVNLEGTVKLLEACRRSKGNARVVFASSLAVFGGEGCPPVVGDETKPLPQTTYGMTKLAGELMINDYSRKDFIDGRALRLPTIFIRPGKPNAALSSFASGLFREPLNGVDFELPVSREQGVPLLSCRKVVEAFILAMECDGAALGDDRTLTLPSRKYLVRDMISTLERVAEQKGITLGKIIDEADPVVIKVVEGWPIGTESKRAETLGMTADSSVEEVIEAYLEDFHEGRDQS
jgi:nucleoside-diphosphate-sugar epimerase